MSRQAAPPTDTKGVTPQGNPCQCSWLKRPGYPRQGKTYFFNFDPGYPPAQTEALFLATLTAPTVFPRILASRLLPNDQSTPAHLAIIVMSHALHPLGANFLRFNPTVDREHPDSAANSTSFFDQSIPAQYDLGLLCLIGTFGTGPSIAANTALCSLSVTLRLTNSNLPPMVSSTSLRFASILAAYFSHPRNEGSKLDTSTYLFSEGTWKSNLILELGYFLSCKNTTPRSFNSRKYAASRYDPKCLPPILIDLGEIAQPQDCVLPFLSLVPLTLTMAPQSHLHSQMAFLQPPPFLADGEAFQVPDRLTATSSPKRLPVISMWWGSICYFYDTTPRKPSML